MPPETNPSVYYNRNAKKFVGLTLDIRKQLQKVYKCVDIELELIKMKLWLDSDKGADRSGDISFIMYWLDKAHPTAALKQEDNISLIESDTELGLAMREYLAGLWKNREQLLKMNTIHRN